MPQRLVLAVQQSVTHSRRADASVRSIPIRESLDLDQETGSLEVGKSADLIVVDQDILSLADAGHGRSGGIHPRAQDLLQR